MIGFRHADSRYPFLWETPDQPQARWHGSNEGPCQYLADTPDGAWAEFLRHEEIQETEDLAGISRSLWVIEVDDDVIGRAHSVETPAMLGGVDSYEACQDYARELRSRGVTELRAVSAALLVGGARGERTDGDLCEAGDRNGEVWVLYGRRPELRAWRAVDRGAPAARVLGLVRHLGTESPEDSARVLDAFPAAEDTAFEIGRAYEEWASESD